MAQTPALNGWQPSKMPYGSQARKDGSLLIEACEWLTGRNIALARDYGIGLEEEVLFDQDKCKLHLSFANRRALTCSAQILGTFDPDDRHFTGFWDAASSVAYWRLDYELMRDLWDREPALMELRRPIALDRLMPLLALVCKTIKADGIYRCFRNGMSLFLAIYLKPTDRPEAVPFATTALSGACDLVSAGDHDPVEHRLRVAIPDQDGGALCITVGQNERAVHRVRQIGGELRIVGESLDWGGGFIWPDRAVI